MKYGKDPMKKLTDETYALTGAGGVKKARFRLFIPEEHESEKSVVLVLSYALQSVPVPDGISALIAKLPLEKGVLTV